jgi:hypothetical protein
MHRHELKSVKLALEFREKPFGIHSPDLQYLLHMMRQPTPDPFHVLLIEKPGELWQLATMVPGGKVRPKPSGVWFKNLAEAEWYVFGARWERLFGERLEID